MEAAVVLGVQKDAREPRVKSKLESGGGTSSSLKFKNMP